MKIRKLMEANEPLEDVSYSLEVEQDFDGPDVGVETGVSGLLLDQISKVAQNINDYNMMRANLEGYPEIDELIQSLADQENETLGKLQSALKSISPNAELIMNGAVEAESELDPGSPIDEALDNEKYKVRYKHFFRGNWDEGEYTNTGEGLPLYQAKVFKYKLSKNKDFKDISIVPLNEAYGRKWKPSKTAAREFAQKMNEIDDFCRENGISQSSTSDSYYFNIDGQNYRVSNHSVEASNRNSGGKYHSNGRDDDTIYIHASKTRLIDIYNALKAGKKLDGRGNEVKIMKEAHYGGAFDIEDDQFLTRDDLDEFGYYVEEELNNSDCSCPKEFQYAGCWIDNNVVTCAMSDGDYEHEIDFRVDMRRIRSPRDLIKRYAPGAIEEFKEAFETYYSYEM